jgi:hypothetical protein
MFEQECSAVGEISSLKDVGKVKLSLCLIS